MKRLLGLSAILALSLLAAAQTNAKSSGPDAALMQKVWDGWNTLDPANAAPFYDQGAQDVFFDITPLEYHGWKAYESGAKAVLAGFSAVNCKVTQPKVHPAGRIAWSTAIVHCDGVAKSGEKQPMDMRWTAIWQKAGDDWKIVHEHISVPMAGSNEPGGGARPARKPKKS